MCRRQERCCLFPVLLSHGCIKTAAFLYVTPLSLVEICRRYQKSCGFQHRDRCIHLVHPWHGWKIWIARQYLAESPKEICQRIRSWHSATQREGQTKKINSIKYVIFFTLQRRSNNWQTAGKWIGFLHRLCGLETVSLPQTSQEYNMYEQYPGGLTLWSKRYLPWKSEITPLWDLLYFRKFGKDTDTRDRRHTHQHFPKNAELYFAWNCNGVELAVQKLLVPERINARVFSKHIRIACMATCSDYAATRMKYSHKYGLCLFVVRMLKKDSYRRL